MNISKKRPFWSLQERKKRQDSGSAAVRLPETLWVQGDYRPSDARAVAIIGSRKNTAEGGKFASSLSSELARTGVCIVSGLALGIDGFAHRGALKVGGRTLAVLGTGLEHIRPAVHRPLAREIASSGALLSPFDPSFSGYRDGRNYLQRNEIIAALSRVLVVADAKTQSGSLSTVRAALRLGRPVGLAPHLASQSWAADFLIDENVFLVHGVSDVLERMGS